MSSLPLPVIVRLFPPRGRVVPPAGGRLSQPADLLGIEDLDRDGTAERLRGVTGRIRALEAEQQALVAHWGDLHAPGPEVDLSGHADTVTGERFLPAGPV